MGLIKLFVGLLGLVGLSSGASVNYGLALENSLMFYKAQRSGKLPDRDIPWRFDSFTNLTTSDGVDVSGGFFDAGDTVKFNLPQAVTITSLANSVLRFENGYKKAGENVFKNAIDVIKWGADYLSNCVLTPTNRKVDPGGTRIVAQVGSGELDHIQWKRPDEISSYIPIYMLDSSHPGSDLAGAIAAALASSSIVLRQQGDTKRADEYIDKAKSALQFGISYKGLYSNSVTDASKFYKSSSFYDDLAEGAVWIYKATNDSTYLSLSEELFNEHVVKEDGLGKWPSNDWDNRVFAVAWELKEITSKDVYSKLYDRFVEQWLRAGEAGSGVKKTPDGFGWLDTWGSTRHNGNSMFLIALDQSNNKTKEEYILKQVNYILGENKVSTSYLVGFGDKFPRYVHHRASSCPLPPKSCGWEYFSTTEPNPNILTGALVGGPALDGSYFDKRDNYIQNEVALDYSYGFTGVLAAILEKS